MLFPTPIAVPFSAFNVQDTLWVWGSNAFPNKGLNAIVKIRIGVFIRTKTTKWGGDRAIKKRLFLRSPGAVTVGAKGCHNSRKASNAIKVAFIPATIPPTRGGASAGENLKNPKKFSHTHINKRGVPEGGVGSVFWVLAPQTEKREGILGISLRTTVNF